MIKRLILLTLILFFIATFSAYGAIPAEDTVCIVGGLGDQNGKAYNNGGGATKAVWNANSPSDFMASNGGPKTNCVLGTYTHATTRISATGIGSGVIVGTIAYVDGTNITTGWTKVTAVPDANTIEVAEITATGDTNDVFCLVGGALDTLQNALDCPLNNAASYNRYIYTNLAESVATQIEVDTHGGAANSRIIVKGYNATLTAKAYVTLTATADITAILNFVSAVDYTEWEYLDFHGGGKDENKASYCVYNADAENSSNSHFFSYCKFHDAESDGVSCRGNPWIFTRCEAYLNGRYGFRVYLSIVKMTACSAHDNDNTGIYGCSSESVFIGNLSYDNGKDGTGNGFENISLSDKSVVCGNTAFNNPGDGFQIDDLADSCVIINNAAVGNGAYGFDLQGKTIEPIAFFGYNLAAANTSGHYSEGADNTFANFANGNNVASTQTADELFETITDGSEDFTPETGSDLIDAGLGVQ